MEQEIAIHTSEYLPMGDVLAEAINGDFGPDVQRWAELATLLLGADVTMLQNNDGILLRLIFREIDRITEEYQLADEQWSGN